MTTTAAFPTRPRDLRGAGTPSTRTTAAPRSTVLRVAAVALAGAVLTMIYLQVMAVGQLSPVSTTVSDLIFVDGQGWLFGVSAVLLAVASLALTVALARTRLPGGSLITAVLGLWSVGLVVAAAFPTDPLGMESVSLVGEIHRYAGAAMYVSLPLAGWLVYLRSSAVPAWSPYRRAIRKLSLAAAALGVLFTLSHAPTLFPGSLGTQVFDGRLIHGLVERGLIGCLFGLLLAIGVGVARTNQGSPESNLSTQGRPDSEPAVAE